MELENNVAALTVSVSQVVDRAGDVLTQGEALLEQGGAPGGEPPERGVSAPVIVTPQTLTVGPVHDFQTIKAAWDSLRGSIITADVTIDVIDGRHVFDPATFDNQPYAHRVRIEGNMATPGLCVLELRAAGDGTLHGPNFEHIKGLEFSGFKIESSDPAALWGLRVAESANVFSAPNSIILEGCKCGVRVMRGGVYVAEGARITGSLIGAWIYNGTAELDKIDMTGVGVGVSGDLATHSYGARVEGSGNLQANEGVARSFRFNWFAHEGGSITVRGGRSEDSVVAFGAYREGFINGNPTDAGIKTSALNSEQLGFHTHFGGTIWADEAIADNTFIGFSAYYLAMTRCVGSTARNCGSYGYRSYGNGVVYANGSDGNLSGNAINHSASHGSAHNFGSYVFHTV